MAEVAASRRAPNVALRITNDYVALDWQVAGKLAVHCPTQAVVVRRPQDASIGDDRGNEPRRRDIERRMAHGKPLWCDARAADVRHLARASLLDRARRA